MNAVTDRLWIAGCGFAGFLAFLGSGCERGSEVESPGHGGELRRVPITDEFAGRTVSDIGLAQEVVLARLENAPTANDRAPETSFTEARTNRTVLLSELIREKPAVLVFGSWSCSALNVTVRGIENLSKRFSGSVGFFFVYIREAHPAGGYNPILQGSSAKQEMPRLADAETLEVRRKTALEFAGHVGFGFPVLVDTMDDAAAVRWGAWPLRIFVIDREGDVIYAGDQGPWHFKPVDSYSHDPPPPALDSVLRRRLFDRTSLESFLEQRFGNTP